MRHTVSLVFLIGLALFPIASKATPSQNAPSQMDVPRPSIRALMSEFSAIQCGQPLKSWQILHPTARLIEFRGDSYRTDRYDYWCYQGKLGSGHGYFYALPGESEPIARLHQYTAQLDGDPAPLRQAHHQLSEWLSSKFGSPAKPSSVDALGSGYWVEVRQWKTPEADTFLYLDSDPVSERVYALCLLTRSRQLVDAVQEDESTHAVEGIPAMIPELSSEVARFWPSEARLLRRSNLRDARSQMTAISGIEKLLKAARDLPLEKRGIALLAADRLMEMLCRDLPGERPGSVNPLLTRMKALGIAPDWDQLGSAWNYKNPLLKRAWKECGSTRWGEWAFARLLDMNWNTEELDGADFPDIIREGEAFLRTHPLSVWRPQIQLMVGLGYETWWSLSKAATDDIYVTASDYAPGSQKARRQAIRYYDLAKADLPPKSSMKRYIEWHSPRLRLGVDTNCRRYFRIYD